MKPSVAIVGQGAIGSLLAARCEISGFSYSVLHHRPLQSMHFCNKEHDFHFTPDALAPTQLSSVDYLILPIKAFQVMGFIRQYQQQLQQTTIILMHNGMGTIDPIRTVLPETPLLAATTSYGAYKPTDNAIIETGLGETHIGWITTPAPQPQFLDMLLPPCTWHQNIESALWQKLAVNAAINPLSAFNQCTNGTLTAEQYQQDIEAICQEVASVMTAEGYPTSGAALKATVDKVITATAANYSSMNRDIYYQRPTEIDFINGYVLKKAQQHQIKTPVNLKLYEQLKALEQKSKTPS